jgi:hypothetical protein
LDPEKACAVTVGTDGFSPNKHNILSVSFAHAPEGEFEHKTVYISGADAGKVVEYTEVAPAKYNAEAVGIPRALELLAPIEEAEFYVGYAVDRFTLSWLRSADLSALVDNKPWLDTLDVCKAKGAEQLDTELQRAASLWELWAGFAERWSNSRIPGYAFNDVCHRAQVFDFVEGIPDLEAKAPRLWALYQSLLLSV